MILQVFGIFIKKNTSISVLESLLLLQICVACGDLSAELA